MERLKERRDEERGIGGEGERTERGDAERRLLCARHRPRAKNQSHAQYSSSPPLPLFPSPPLSVLPSFPLILLLHLAATVGLYAGNAAAADHAQPADPFVYLFDTGKAARKPLRVSAVGTRSGWKGLEEDDLSHRFAGDVAMANDKLVVLVRRRGPGAEVYSRTAGGCRHRAVLMPLPMDGRHVAEWTAVKIIENQPGAAVLEVSHRTDTGGRPRARYRLTTGRALVEVVPLADADRLVVWTLPELLVVPEFLADDAVFGPRSSERSRMGLPTEGLLLHMLAGGDAMLMCVWPERSRPADALMTGTAANRRLGGCEIRCLPERPVWVALLEGSSLWHTQAIPAGGVAEPVAPPWEPSFPAKWRVDLLGDGVFAKSEDLDDGAAPALPATQPVLVYPIDRSRTTPLSQFTPGDVVRDTLGVGPCQYVLQCEGLADAARPTPENVAAYVEQQLRKPKADRDRKEIGRQLAGAVEHVRQAEARIAEYRGFAVEVETLLAAEPGGGDRSELEDLQHTVARLKRITRSDPDSPDAGEHARRLADAILALVDKDDPSTELEVLGAGLRELSARQSRVLAGCRLTVRWLREQARASGAGKVRARCERLLKQT